MKILSISEEKKRYEHAPEVEGIVERIRAEKDQLVGIDISENSFSAECIMAIVAAVKDAPSIESVSFRGIFTGRHKDEVEKSLRHICEGLEGKKGISYLDLSDNALSLNGMRILIPLIERLVGLKHLVLNNNGIGPDGGNYLAEALELLAKQSNSLVSLEAGRNRLEGSAERIGQSLALFPYVDSIKIYQNSVPTVAMAEFLRCVSKLRVRVLDIGDNFLLEHGSRILGDCLNEWPIEVLNASDCLIGDQGMKQLSETLKEKEFIQGELVGEAVMDLSCNDITRSSIEEVKDFIKKLGRGKVVMTGNEFQTGDIEELAAVSWNKGGEFVYEGGDEDLLFFSDEDVEEQESEEAAKELEDLEEHLAELTLSLPHELKDE